MADTGIEDTTRALKELAARTMVIEALLICRYANDFALLPAPESAKAKDGILTESLDATPAATEAMLDSRHYKDVVGLYREHMKRVIAEIARIEVAIRQG